MQLKKSILWVFAIMLFLQACNKGEQPSNEPKLIVKLNVDPTQQRLGNTGAPVSMPAGHAGQNPVFNKIAAHYFELAPNAFTGLGHGAVLYKAPETTVGGANAIDFNQSIVVAPGEVFLEIPLKDVPAGSYEWVRLSLSYQNYDVAFSFNGTPLTGTIASFVGFNTYLQKYTIKDQEVTVNANKLQGYWGFETLGLVQTGQSPAGATTVPNPLFLTSPIPQGSCVVTGQFSAPLVITGHEEKDIHLSISLSTNQSFEWVDDNGNGKWDVSTGAVESVVDMGLRGLLPIVEN